MRQLDVGRESQIFREYLERKKNAAAGKCVEGRFVNLSGAVNGCGVNSECKAMELAKIQEASRISILVACSIVSAAHETQFKSVNVRS